MLSQLIFLVREAANVHLPWLLYVWKECSSLSPWKHIGDRGFRLCPGPFHTSGIPGLQHTINMDGRDEFTEDSECCSNNSQEVQEQDSISGTRLEGEGSDRWTL